MKVEEGPVITQGSAGAELRALETDHYLNAKTFQKDSGKSGEQALGFRHCLPPAPYVASA